MAPAETVSEILVSTLELDLSIQVRETLDVATVERYVDVLDELPPVLVFEIEGGHRGRRPRRVVRDMSGVTKEDV